MREQWICISKNISWLLKYVPDTNIWSILKYVLAMHYCSSQKYLRGSTVGLNRLNCNLTQTYIPRHTYLIWWSVKTNRQLFTNTELKIKFALHWSNCYNSILLMLMIDTTKVGNKDNPSLEYKYWIACVKIEIWEDVVIFLGVASETWLNIVKNRS